MSIRVTFIGDMHFGYGYGTETEEDAYRQAEEAFDIAVREKSDLIVCLGDIFDARLPRQEVYARAFKLFQKPLHAQKNGVKLEKFIDKLDGDLSHYTFSGIPVVAINGNHDSRGQGIVNPVQLLEKAGFLVHLDRNCVVFNVKEQRIAFHGVSSVPEYAFRKTLDEWQPRSVSGAVNVFLFHQTTREWFYAEDDETFVSVDELPRGFDAYIGGHIHENLSLPEKKAFFTGSTVITQQKKSEAEKKKGVYVIDFALSGRLDARFLLLEKQRPVVHEELKFKKVSVQEIEKQCKLKIQELLEKHAPRMKPLIVLKLEGVVDGGAGVNLVSEERVAQGFEAIVTLNSSKLEGEDFRAKIEKLRAMQAGKMSVDDLGLKIINDLLKESSYKGENVEELLALLGEDDIDKVVQRAVQRAENA